MSVDNPHFFLYGLTVGVSYSFEVSAINLAGPSEPIVMDYVVGESMVPYMYMYTCIAVQFGILVVAKNVFNLFLNFVCYMYMYISLHVQLYSTCI